MGRLECLVGPIHGEPKNWRMKPMASNKKPNGPQIFQNPPVAPCPTEIESTPMPRVFTQASSAASAAPTMSRIRPSWERLMAKIDRTELLTQGLMVLPLFPLAVLTELCSREIGTKQAIRDAWSSWKAHFLLKPNAHVEVRLRRRLPLRQQRSATGQTSPPTCC